MIISFFLLKGWFLLQKSPFTYIGEKTYSCGDVHHKVKEYRHDETGIEFVLIPGGSFNMGSDKEDDAKPIHQVSVDSFLMAKYEVTQGVWQKAMNSAPWNKEKVKKGNDYAASCISWDDANSFCEKYDWRLPTEAEWEYAYRAGTSSEYYWGDLVDGQYAWYSANTNKTNEKYAHQVGKKLPNAFGLHDMAGNAWEWCSDWYSSNYYASSPSKNPQGILSGEGRVLRGGNWNYGGWFCRSWSRARDIPSRRSSYYGFRPCVTWKNLSEIAQ